MSIINGAVIAGFTFVLDVEDKVQLTHDRLNLLGIPTVTVTLTNSVQNEDLVNDTIEKEKMATSVAAEIPSGVATVAAEDTNDVDVTIQVNDINGNAVLDVVAVSLWLSDTAAGNPPAALPSSGSPTIITSQGVIIDPVTNIAPGLYLTDANGVLALQFTESGALEKFFNMVINNKHIAGSQALTWT